MLQKRQKNKNPLCVNLLMNNKRVASRRAVVLFQIDTRKMISLNNIDGKIHLSNNKINSLIFTGLIY